MLEQELNMKMVIIIGIMPNLIMNYLTIPVDSLTKIYLK